MQRLEPILKSWVIWLTLVASAAGFAALVVTDGDAHRHPKTPNRHPTRTDKQTSDAPWRGQIAYAVPTGGADATVVQVATPLRHDAAAVYRAPAGEVIRGLAWSPDGAASRSSSGHTAAMGMCSSWT